MERHPKNASPLSYLSVKENKHHLDRDASAPEVVDASMTPTTIAGSPATGYSHPSTTSSRDIGIKDGAGAAKEAFQFDGSEKIALPSATEFDSSPYPQVVDGGDASGHGTGQVGDEKSQSKIFGLSRKAFFISLILLCIVAGAAVGGGVARSLALKKSKADSESSSSTR